MAEGGIITVLSHNPLWFYFAVITVATFFRFGADKVKAQRGQWRTPEATLLGLCLIGGSVGGGLAIWLFRHKRSKASFMRAFYGIVTLQVCAAAVCFWFGLDNVVAAVKAFFAAS